MFTQDPDFALKSLSSSERRLCFYPSCGNRTPWVVACLDADVFVFSDKYPQTPLQRDLFWSGFQEGFSRFGNCSPVLESATAGVLHFRFGDKHGFLFFQDNNDVLARIQNADWKISTFVGICDGCMEGGNYECIHDEPFLSKLLATSADGMNYITDHSRLLARGDGWSSSFRHHATHPSGWDFTLHSILFRTDQDTRYRFQILCFPDHRRFPPKRAISPLASLLPIRRFYRGRILSLYRVTDRNAPPTRFQLSNNETEWLL